MSTTDGARRPVGEVLNDLWLLAHDMKRTPVERRRAYDAWTKAMSGAPSTVGAMGTRLGTQRHVSSGRAVLGSDRDYEGYVE